MVDIDRHTNIITNELDKLVNELQSEIDDYKARITQNNKDIDLIENNIDNFDDIEKLKTYIKSELSVLNTII